MAKKKFAVEDAKKLELQITKVFMDNLELCKKREGVIVNRGGAGSGKSHAICQLMVYKFLTEKNKKILIIRKSLPSLRISVQWLLHRIFNDFGVSNRVKIEKVHLNYHFGDNTIHLGSVDNPEKLKSTEWSYVWMEEATEFTLEDYRLIRSRMRYPTHDGNPNHMFLSFNPIDESHWIKEKLLQEEEAVELQSTYRDNPFLQETYVKHLEELCDYDVNFHRVYALGEWGRLDNLIYPNWQVCGQGEVPLEATTVYGLDFGFNAPTALIKCVVKGKDCWEEELLYREKLTNSDLINQLKIIIPTTERQRPIYADSAEPDRIVEIRNAGFNVKPAHKNIKDGIDFVKRMRVHILDSSNNLKKEKRSYSWKTDKNNHEKVLDEPIPNINDHLMDAERYALYTHFGAGKEFRIRWLT